MATIEVKAHPGARKDSVEEKDGRYIVRTTAPADKGKANRAVAKLLQEHLGKRVRLVRGEKSREKVFEVEG